MEISFELLGNILFGTIIIFFVYYLFYRKFVYSVIDPLFIFLVTNSFATYLAIAIIPTEKDLLHFFGCQLSVWLGFFIVYSRKSNINIMPTYSSRFAFFEYLPFKYTTYFLLTLYIISNVFVGYYKGFALFASDPTNAKFANFQEGFGLFRKINWSAGTFVMSAFLFLVFKDKNKKDIFILLLLVFFTAVDGSKGALLRVGLSSGAILFHPIFLEYRKRISKFSLYLLLLAIGVFAIFFIILIKQNESFDDAILAFVRRFLYSADSLLYFYTPANMTYFDTYSLGEYFQRITNPILGFLRLQSYQEVLGNILYDNLRIPGSIPDGITVGPVIPFYTEGRIFFYYWLAFPYCIFIGYLYASIRVYYFSLTKTSFFWFIFMASFFRLASAILNDFSLAIIQLFDLCFFVIPPYIIINYLLRHKLLIRMG